MSAELSLDNPVFKSFIGYAVVVLVKTMLMSMVTAHYRMKNKVFASEEDTAYFKENKKGVVLNHPKIERVRRAHQNDLENIIPFVLLGLLYTATGPALSVALLHFRIFTATRIMHTVIYLLQVPQPARAVTFIMGMFVNLSLAFQIIKQASFV